MLVLAHHRPADAAAHRRHRRRDERRGASWAPTGSSPPSCRRCDRSRGRPLSAANLTARARRLGRDGQPPRRPTSTGCRTPTRCAARRRCTAPRATPSSTPRRSPGASSPSAVDNPVVLADDGRVESNGNFHGAPVAYVLDFLAIVAADVASISERRTDRFLDRARNHDLPPFLADDPGVDSGHMIAQYTQAAIVSELKRLAAPASVDSIPSQRDAGGPRVDGLVRRPQAAPLGRRAHPRRRDRAADRGPRRSTCDDHGSAEPPRRPPAPSSPAASSTASGRPGPTATCPPRSRPPSALVSSGAVLAAVEDADRRAA